MPKAAKDKASKRKKDIHPNSRKAAQLVRNEHHRDRVDKRKAERDALQNAKCHKIMWFSENLESTAEKLTQEEMISLIEAYLGRFDEELDVLKEDINISRHKSQASHCRREEKLKTVLDHERHLFDVGAFEAPDLTCAKTLSFVRDWNGKKDSLPNIKMKRFKKVKSDHRDTS